MFDNFLYDDITPYGEYSEQSFDVLDAPGHAQICPDFRALRFGFLWDFRQKNYDLLQISSWLLHKMCWIFLANKITREFCGQFPSHFLLMAEIWAVFVCLSVCERAVCSPLIYPWTSKMPPRQFRNFKKVLIYYFAHGFEVKNIRIFWFPMWLWLIKEMFTTII